MINEKQLEERKGYIGGSDVGSILGYNKYTSPIDIYFEKVEGLNRTINNNFVYWGNKEEPMIREIFSELTGLKTLDITETKYHKKYNFLAANIDGLILDKKDNPIAILEIKTVSPYVRKEWGKPINDLNIDYGDAQLDYSGFKNNDGFIPLSYLCQIILYAAIYEIDKVYLAAKFGNDLPVLIYQYNRDLELEVKVISQLVAFWKNCVEKEIPPDPSKKNDIEKAFPDSKKDTFVKVDNNHEDIYWKIVALKTKEKEIKEEITNLSSKLMKYMGNNEILIDNGGAKLATWKNIDISRLDNKKLKAENTDLYEKFLVKSKSRRFQIY